MPVSITVNVGELEPHLSNPRLPRTAESIQAAYRLMAREDPRGLVKLAESIADKPWDNSTLLMLTTASGNPAFGPYTVREGNRRLTAIRGLQDPDLLEGVLAPAEMRALRNAATRASLPAVVSSLVFGADEEADLLDRISRRHGGEGNGEGVRPWGVRARTRALGGDDSPAVALLDYIDENGAFGDTASISPTTLSRILSTPQVRDALGITITRGKLHPIGALFSPEAMKKLLDIMRTEGFTVGNVFSAQQRKELAEELLESREKHIAEDEDIDLVEESVDNSEDSSSDGSADEDDTNVESGDDSESESSGTGSSRAPAVRRTLVPKNFPYGTGNPRISDILKHGKLLRIDQMPSVGGITLRVILELIVDEYRSRLTPPGNERQKLREKTLAVALDLETRGLITAAEKNAVEHICNSRNYGITTIKTLHSYVHSLRAPVSVDDVRDHWDHLDKFLRTAWMNLP